MPHREAMMYQKRALQRLLLVQGVLHLAVSASWLATSTQGRLAGIGWLKDFLGWMPGARDVKVGIGWLAMALLMIAGGAWGCRARKIETAGTVAALAYPVLIGFFFLAAYLTGEHRTGWVTTAAYWMFSSTYAVILTLPKPKEPPIDTAALQRLEERISDDGEQAA